MARDKGREALRRDVLRLLQEVLQEEPLPDQVEVVLAAVLPHFKLAYQRGVMAERSRTGYRALRDKNKEKSE
ncbi:hypothetical protein ACFPM3_20410 [Streptomyces coeruleoprunus]|uniref:Uncharacterized protein n=1 Tax=Streptomyces coeruleoprunus TaxID=285563 RepID=A0ABV9XGG3_9ACTN